MGGKVKNSIAETFREEQAANRKSLDAQRDEILSGSISPDVVGCRIDRMPNITVVEIDWREVVTSRRYGKFVIDQHLLEGDPAMMAAVMARCIVVRAESIYNRLSFEYIALGPDFEPCPMGMLVPDYDARFRFERHDSPEDPCGPSCHFEGFFKS
jgi:hypothetical protein